MRIALGRIVQSPQALKDIAKDFATLRAACDPGIGQDQTLRAARGNFVIGGDRSQRTDNRRLESDRESIADRRHMDESEVSYGVGQYVDMLSLAAHPERQLSWLGRPDLAQIIEHDPMMFGCKGLQFASSPI